MAEEGAIDLFYPRGAGMCRIMPVWVDSTLQGSRRRGMVECRT